MQILKSFLLLLFFIVATVRPQSDSAVPDSACDKCIADGCTFCTVYAAADNATSLNDLDTKDYCLCADDADYDSCVDWREDAIDNVNCLDIDDVVEAVETLATAIIVIIVVGGLCCCAGICACIYCCMKK